jgi:hypothetical protein
MIILILFLTFWGTVFISGAIALLISTIIAKAKGGKGSRSSNSEGIDTRIYIITWFALIGLLVIWSILSVRHATGHCLVNHGLLNMIRLSIVHLIGVGGVQCN